MKKVGLIGSGYWGTILHEKLKALSNVKFVCNSKVNYKDYLDLVDYVFIATPNKTHYEIVKVCLEEGKNVFCEKPLTPTLKQSKELFQLAEKHNVKLYVDDVFNYRKEQKYINKLVDNIKVIWNKKSNNTFYDLLYHDLYLIYPILKEKEISINWPTINNITFKYGYTDDRIHKINNIDFTHSNNSNDALLEMITSVLADEVDYKYNKQISLFCNYIIDKIQDKNYNIL